ncbi:MAG TPA: Rieske (2Fe-2S) protein [Pseudonocardia sp.]|nr:Rieske (2Fe-2S) protein [Pseudonocardia sp.]
MAELSRRVVLAGVCTGCAVAVTACSGYGPGRGSPPAPAAGGTEPPPGATPPAGPGTPPGRPPLASTGDIPVGGGTVFAAQDVVVTQPVAGEFRAFGATCTHQGCAVAEVADGTINCPCHGSRYAVADGSVVGGPAPQPLPERAITVDGDAILLG